MKKNFIKVISVILCISLMTSVFAVAASAAYSPEQDYSFYPELESFSVQDTAYPTIILPGINHSESYLADENNEPILDKNGKKISGGLLLIDSSNIMGDVIGLVPDVLLSLITQKPTASLADNVYKTVSNVMGIQQMDNNGETVNNLITKTYNYPVSQMDEGTRGWFYRMIPMEPYAAVFGEDNIYLYTFPLYGNPMEGAEGLHDYIDMVKEQTGAEKVNIISVSLGGSLLSAFLDTEPDYSEINKIVNIVSLMNGTELMADFMARRFNISDSFIYSDYLPLIMKESTGSSASGYLINILLRILPKKALYTVLTAAFSGILDTVILNDPQFWAMLPGDEYEALADRYLRDGNHDVLLAKTDRYQTARINFSDNITAAANSGIQVYNIAGYGLSYEDGEYNFFGIVKSSATANCDGIIPISSTTMGASYVKKGSQFSADYLAAANEKYISPDKSVDASTCLFPDTTWFFAGQHHEVGRNDAVIRLATAILAGAVTDVDSSPLFPQFNGARNTRGLVRSDGGYIFKAQEVLASDNYTAEQKAAVQKAYDDVLVMLADTVCDSEKATAASDALYDSLVAVGVCSPRAVASPATNIIEKILKSISDMLMRKVGGNGFSDANK